MTIPNTNLINAKKLADAIVTVTRDNGGQCRDEDLHQLGFTPVYLQRHGRLAQSLAAVEMMRDQPGGHA